MVPYAFRDRIINFFFLWAILVGVFSALVLLLLL